MNELPISRFVGHVKEFSTKQIVEWCRQNNETQYIKSFLSAARESKAGHTYHVWQKRFDNVIITKHEDMLTKLEYIHANQVREQWNLCKVPEDFQYSSAANYYQDKDVGLSIHKLA